MFTGIIESLGSIKKIKKLDGGLELTVEAMLNSELTIDDSIAINGVCHTVVSRGQNEFVVQSVEETLRKTTIGMLREGDPVNLEQSLTLNKRLDGHIVQGHADTTGKIISVEKEGTNWLLSIRYPEEFQNLIVGRGSIAIDGISLTVAREHNHEFTVAIIPYTYEHTNLSSKHAGNYVNLEFDILGKYVQKMMQPNT